MLLIFFCLNTVFVSVFFNRLLIQLDETEKNFDMFWADHEKKLQQCLKLRLFEQDFREVCKNNFLHN